MALTLTQTIAPASGLSDTQQVGTSVDLGTISSSNTAGYAVLSTGLSSGSDDVTAIVQESANGTTGWTTVVSFPEYTTAAAHVQVVTWTRAARYCRIVANFTVDGTYSVAGSVGYLAPTTTTQTAAATWYMHAAADSTLTAQTLYKNDGDIVWLEWDASGLPEVRAGATVSTATLSITSGVTISGQSTGDTTVGAFYTGGTAGTSYTATILATLSDGTVYERSGTLTVNTQ